MSKYTDITMILDRSGSMTSVAADTIGGVNRFIEAQQNAPGACDFQLIQFDDEYEAGPRTGIGSVPLLTPGTFCPRGNTALHAAIGRTIDAVGRDYARRRQAARPDKVVCIIVTDGEENFSGRVAWGWAYSASIVAQMVKHQTERYSWEFLYIGANQDAVLNANRLHIPGSHALNYTHNAGGTQAVYGSLSDNVVKMRSGVARCCAFGEDDRAAQEKAKETNP